MYTPIGVCFGRGRGLRGCIVGIEHVRYLPEFFFSFSVFYVSILDLSNAVDFDWYLLWNLRTWWLGSLVDCAYGSTSFR